MTQSNLSKYSQLRNDANYSYLRWLMLIAVGAFSLTAGVAFGKPFLGHQLLALKAALSMNVIGILFGAVAVHGESKLAQGALYLVCDREKYTLLGNNESAASVPDAYALHWLYKKSELAFYFSLSLSLMLWLAFIWLS
jgi:hypothetical protein